MDVTWKEVDEDVIDGEPHFHGKGEDGGDIYHFLMPRLAFTSVFKPTGANVGAHLRANLKPLSIACSLALEDDRGEAKRNKRPPKRTIIVTEAHLKKVAAYQQSPGN